MTLNINMPETVNYILSELEVNGHEAYIVGGCVRDSLMNISPHDWDICTSAKPNEVIDIFKSYQVIKTGIKHGTVTVVIDDEQYEITTFRIDGQYTDNRRPDEVYFTENLIEDLARRDFTINAMAYNPKSGLIDPFFGQFDISKRTIRCVGDSDDRFNEDALRILRCIRFSAQFQYSIESSTAVSIIKNCHLLRNIAVERIVSELQKTLIYSSSYLLARAMQEIIPELNCERFAQFNVIKALSSKASLIAKMAYFFDFNESEIAPIFERLKLDNKTRRAIVTSQKIANETIKLIKSNTSIETIAKYVLHTAEPFADDVIYLVRLRSIEAEDRELARVVLAVKYFIHKRDNKPYKVSHLSINGFDVMALGFKGEEVGCKLNELLDLVITNKLENTQNNLISYLLQQKQTIYKA